MISAILLLLAVFFNAVMDATENAPNFNESRLRSLPVQFWLKEQSWKYAAKLFGYRFDAWHIAKSCMVICMIMAAILFDLPVKKLNDVLFYLICAGIIWNGGFWLFYHKILGVK